MMNLLKKLAACGLSLTMILSLAVLADADQILDGLTAAFAGGGVIGAAAGGQGSQSRDRSQSGDNFLAIHYGILSFLSESPLCKAI